MTYFAVKILQTVLVRAMRTLQGTFGPQSGS
jgi:hypothetical protein